MEVDVEVNFTSRPWKLFYFHEVSKPTLFHGSNFASMQAGLFFMEVIFFHGSNFLSSTFTPMEVILLPRMLLWTCLWTTGEVPGTRVLVGLRWLLRRANYIHATCGWAQGVKWEGPTAGPRYQVGAGRRQGVQYLMEADSTEAYTTSMEEVNLTFMEDYVISRFIFFFHRN